MPDLDEEVEKLHQERKKEASSQRRQESRVENNGTQDEDDDQLIVSATFVCYLCYLSGCMNVM